MYEPDAFIVPGFNPGMPVINKPPIGLTDQEILCVIAYLQTLGGTPTVTLRRVTATTRPGRGATARARRRPPDAGSRPGAAPPERNRRRRGSAGAPAPAAPKKGEL